MPTSQRPRAVVRRRTAGNPEITEETKRLRQAAAQVQVRAGAPSLAVVPERKAIKAPSFQMGPVRPLGDRFINCMIYGPYGHGKTTFAGTADDVPEMRDVIFINAESGDMSLTNRRSLDVITINKYSQAARIFEYLTLHCMYRDQGNVEKLLELEREYKASIIPISDQTKPVQEGRTWFEEQRLRSGKPMDEPYLYRTVIIDSLSELHKYLIYKFTGVDIGKTRLDEEIERMEEWQPAQELFRLLIRSFRDLPMNSIFVSAESIEPEQRNKKRNPRAGMLLPKLAGQMAADVAGFIDLVGYFVRERDDSEGGDHRYLYLGAGYEGWISKHRFENLPDLDYVKDPTLSSLIDLARKDAQVNASNARPGPQGLPVTPPRNTASTATADRSGSASNASSGRGGTRRRVNTLRRG